MHCRDNHKMLNGKAHSKTESSILTLVLYLLNTFATIVFGLIYNNLLIRLYGSPINGLISTLTQFVSLFSIIEGGFTTAAIVATYEPFVNKDYKKLNDILFTTKRIFIRLGLIITACVLVFGSVYIKFIDSPLSYGRTYLLLIVSVMTTSMSLCFLSKYSVALQGANREYIQVAASLTSRTLTWALSIFFIIRGYDITLVYITNLLNVIINIIINKKYEKTNYPFITYKGEYKKNLIKGTGDVLFQKIASTIFTSTDLILISVCINLYFSSVYSLYNQIFKAGLTLLSAISQAPFNSFGQLFKEDDKEEFKKYFDIYQHFVTYISATTLTTLAVLVIPFVSIYTRDVRDFNYVYPTLAILFFLQIYCQSVNRPYGAILNASGNFKMQNLQCGLAAVINIIVSIAFIKLWGINSIIFGSFVGTIIILAINIIQAYKYVISESPIRTFIDVSINCIGSVILIMIFYKLNIQPKNYLELIFYACIVVICSSLYLLGINYVTNKRATVNDIRYIVDLIKKIRGRIRTQ